MLRDTDVAGLRLAEPEPIWSGAGMSFDSQRWRFRDDSGLAWRVRVELPGRTRVLPAVDGLQRIRDLTPSTEPPWAAINGGFYRETNQGESVPLGLVVADGEIHSELGPGGGSGIFQVTDEGPAIIHRSDWSDGPEQALQSVDRLADDGRTLVESRDPERSTRSAVAIGDSHLWLIALAGEASIRERDDEVRLVRTSGHGLPLHTFADFVLETTDAGEVLNLDGGVSTQLEVRTPDLHFVLRGARPVVNALLVRPTR